MNAPSALVLGAISLDVERRGEAERHGPGGVVHHAGRALARLGARTRIVTRAHERDDALLDPLREAGAEVLRRPSRATTSCANDYSGAIDRHELRSLSDAILPEDIPDAWRRADVVQLGPLHPHDLDPETLGVVDGLRGLDVQGLVRRPDGAELTPNPELARFLRPVQVVKASEHELPAILGSLDLAGFMLAHRVDELLVTRGERGATLLVGGDRKEIAARPIHGGSTVGAGDVFLASYLFLRACGRDPTEAARGAVWLCAEKIRVGDVPLGLPPEAL